MIVKKNDNSVCFFEKKKQILTFSMLKMHPIWEIFSFYSFGGSNILTQQIPCIKIKIIIGVTSILNSFLATQNTD